MMFPLFATPQPTARAEMPELTKACSCVHHHYPTSRSSTGVNTPSSPKSRPSPQVVFAEAGEARRRVEQCRAWASVVAEAARDAVSVNVGAVEERDSAFPSAYKGETCDECNLPIPPIPRKRTADLPLWERRVKSRTRSASRDRDRSSSSDESGASPGSGSRSSTMKVENAAKIEPTSPVILPHKPSVTVVPAGSKTPSRHRPPLSLSQGTSRTGSKQSKRFEEPTRRPRSRERSAESEAGYSRIRSTA